MNIQDFRDLVVELLRCEIESEDDVKIVFKRNDYKFDLEVEHFLQTNTLLGQMNSTDEIELSSANKYEILVRHNSRIFQRRETPELIDTVNKVKYNVGRPSDEYLLFFLSKLKDFTQLPIRKVIDPFRFRRLRERQGEIEGQLQIFGFPIFDALKDMIPVFETLQITSEISLSKVKFEQYSYSYLFSLSYNLNVAISSYRFLEEFVSPLRATYIRRLPVEDLEAPKRFYVKDLVLHYQKGISSENLDHQFLSFFHVLEHFFESIYNEDILNRIKSELTKPDFSYKKNNHIEGLIKIIQNKLKYKNEEFIINEMEGLELTLKRYVTDIEEVKKDLSNIDIKLIDYFKTTDVPFSGGNKVNFEISNEDEILKNLAKRIYLTRNAIVHSKETEKVKYMPFRDDRHLIPENTLMRVIVEKVIINTSKEI